MENELLHFNKNHDKLGRFSSGPGGSSSSSGSIFKRRKEKKLAEKAAKAEEERLAKMTPAQRAAETRRKKAEHEAAKNKAIESGDPREIKKYATELDNKQLQEVSNRIKYIEDINKKASERTLKESQKKWDDLNALNKKLETITNLYDTAAMINNTVSDVKLPRVPKNANDKGNVGRSVLDSLNEQLKIEEAKNGSKITKQKQKNALEKAKLEGKKIKEEKKKSKNKK